MFQKDMRISLLLDFYGDLLSEHRREALDLYYNEDLSLSEISVHMDMSRQGVRDLVKKGERQLEECEEKLGLADRFSRAKTDLEEIAKAISAVSERTDPAVSDELKQIADKLASISI